MVSEIFLRGLEHAPPEAAALIFGRQIKLEDFAAIGQGRHAIASVAHIAGQLVAEVENQQP